MGKREQFVGALTCECGAKGFAHFEENENPAHNNWELDTVLERVDAPFRITKKGAVKCGECGRKVRDA